MRFSAEKKLPPHGQDGQRAADLHHRIMEDLVGNVLISASLELSSSDPPWDSARTGSRKEANAQTVTCST